MNGRPVNLTSSRNGTGTPRTPLSFNYVIRVTSLICYMVREFYMQLALLRSCDLSIVCCGCWLVPEKKLLSGQEWSAT